MELFSPKIKNFRRELSKLRKKKHSEKISYILRNGTF